MKTLRIMGTDKIEILINPTFIVSVVETFAVSYITIFVPNSSQPTVQPVPYGISEIEKKLDHAIKMIQLPMAPEYNLLLNTDFFVSAKRTYNYKKRAFDGTNLFLGCPYRDTMAHHPSDFWDFWDDSVKRFSLEKNLLTYHISGDIELIEEALSKI